MPQIFDTMKRYAPQDPAMIAQGQLYELKRFRDLYLPGIEKHLDEINKDAARLRRERQQYFGAIAAKITALIRNNVLTSDELSESVRAFVKEHEYLVENGKMGKIDITKGEVGFTKQVVLELIAKVENMKNVRKTAIH